MLLFDFTHPFKMEPLSHERAENIALTFTQSPVGSQRVSVLNASSILNFETNEILDYCCCPSRLSATVAMCVGVGGGVTL